jgi:hypothetical protein
VPILISIIFDREELQAPRGKGKKNATTLPFVLKGSLLLLLATKSNKPQVGFTDY